jgi:ubiquinone/menaquinone biosynthesis C-methylase UbiE
LVTPLALQFDDASFDRVLASQVLLHVPRPDVALGEIARVLDPRGELSLTEIDWGSISIECTDRELSRRFTALVRRTIDPPLRARRDLHNRRSRYVPGRSPRASPVRPLLLHPHHLHHHRSTIAGHLALTV